MHSQMTNPVSHEQLDDDLGDEDESTPVATPSKGNVVSAVDRAMILLTMVSDRHELGVTEAALALGVAPSTAARLLTTMAGHGYVSQGSNRKYRPGPQLSASHKPEGRVRQLAQTLRPVLQELHDELGETAQLLVLVGSDTQFIDGIESERFPRTGLRIGSRIPAYCTAAGKAILAEFDDELVDAIFGGELPAWPSQRISTLQQLHVELSQVRLAGYAVNFAESAPGVHGLSVAVGKAPKHPAAAISVSVPAERFTAPQRKHMLARLRRARDVARGLLQ